MSACATRPSSTADDRERSLHGDGRRAATLLGAGIQPARPRPCVARPVPTPARCRHGTRGALAAGPFLGDVELCKHGLSMPPELGSMRLPHLQSATSTCSRALLVEACRPRASPATSTSAPLTCTYRLPSKTIPAQHSACSGPVRQHVWARCPRFPRPVAAWPLPSWAAGRRAVQHVFASLQVPYPTQPTHHTPHALSRPLAAAPPPP